MSKFRFIFVLVSAAGFGLLSLFAGGLQPADLAKPQAGSWPTYNGDYSGRRYSDLSQINQANVKQLTVAWINQLRSAPVKSTPLEVNGILYLTTPDNVFAVDARTGRSIWHYTRESQGDHFGHRGVGMYGEWLYFTTPDCHLISLNAKDGRLRWDIEIAAPKLGYFSSMAPLVVHNRVLVGVGGDRTDIRGFLDARDPVTGKIEWRWYTEPKAGEPGSETWPKGSDAIEHGGGMTWMTGTYDPELNLTYWGIGNPNPIMTGDVRMGDNLYTDSIVALDADTGKLRWYYQTTPHDTHDYDATQTPVLFDGAFHGKRRRLLAQGNRNGYFFVLDRATGEHLLTKPFIHTNWASGVDEKGRPVPRRDLEPVPQGTLVSPAGFGATNWMSPSFDPDTSLFYISARKSWGIFYRQSSGTPHGYAGIWYNVRNDSEMEAVDYRSGEVKWRHDLGPGQAEAGVLTTAGKVLFTGDTAGNAMALDAVTGKTLWHVPVGDKIIASPMTYQLDGRQYVLTAAGNVLLAWALPEK